MESGLVMLATLIVLTTATVILLANSPKSVTSGGFTWTAGSAVVVALLAAGVLAGFVAARRLTYRRIPLAPVGPLAVMALVVLPALAGGQWGGALLYSLPVVLGSMGGAVLFDRIGEGGPS
jgi:peptidoglycan/LPS O-acetylase OafA/YrhL